MLWLLCSVCFLYASHSTDWLVARQLSTAQDEGLPLLAQGTVKSQVVPGSEAARF